MFRCLDSLPGIIAGALCVLPCAIDSFFEPFVLDHALQEARAGHKDRIALLSAKFVSCGRLLGRLIAFAAVEIKQTAILIDAADAVMVLVMTVALFIFVQLREGVRPPLPAGLPP